MDRNVINAALVKLGVEQPERFDDDRAVNKLKARLTKNGVPAGMTADETALVEGLGFTLAAPTASAPAVEGQAAAKPEKKTSTTKAAPAAKADAKFKVGDYVKSKDKDGVTTGTISKIGGKDGTDVTLKTASGNVIVDLSTLKAATAPAAKTDTGKGKPSAKAPAKGKPAAKGAKTDKPAPKAKEGPNVSEVFRSLFPNKSTVLKKNDVLDKLEKAGVKRGSASIYISWAKRPKARKPGEAPKGNPWPFQLEEGKNKEGDKTLRRIKDM